ncbi:hypothetical protein SprV_0100384000 [Sparganum proliferum]
MCSEESLSLFNCNSRTRRLLQFHRGHSDTKLPVSTCTAETCLTQSPSENTTPATDLEGLPNMSPDEA